MPKKKQKYLVLFDGSNFYHSLKKLGIKHTLNFDYSAFLSWLTSSSTYQAIYNVGEIKYTPLIPETKKLYAGQLRLFAKLKSHHIQIKKGYMLKTNGKYHEKGVDVQIALDIALGAHTNAYDICYLISSDTDLLPAIKQAQALGKQITYVSFAGSVSRAMSNNCTTKIIKKSELLSFVK